MCIYKVKYYNYELKKEVLYECPNEEVADGFCIFHHPEYWKHHQEELEQEFNRKVNEAIENETDLICIGYHLPRVNFSDKVFKKKVYFNKAIFHGFSLF